VMPGGRDGLDVAHFVRERWPGLPVLLATGYSEAASRAVQEGYPLMGYFLWSFLDNFEWAYGRDRRFGITYTDFATQQRIPKASYHWYAHCVQENRVV